MTKLGEIVDFFKETVPDAMKMDFDNVGFLVGESTNTVERVLLALDITDEVVEEAIQQKAQLVVSHHPVFFDLKSVTDCTPQGRKVVHLLAHGIGAICLHTSLDCVDGGVNDALLRALGIERHGILEPEQTLPDGRRYGCGRWGELKCAEHMKDFLPRVKASLASNGLRYHDAGREVKRVAVCGGSGGSMISDALRHGCDTLVTADIKYDQFLTAKECGLNLIDADHFCTENVVLPVLTEMLHSRFPEIELQISRCHRQCAQFM